MAVPSPNISMRVPPDLKKAFKAACKLGRKAVASDIIRSYCIEPYAAFADEKKRQPESIEEFAAWIIAKGKKDRSHADENRTAGANKK